MKYSVKRYWELCDEVEVEANSVGEAIDAAHAMPVDNTQAEFVPDSMNSDSFVDVQTLTTAEGCEVHETYHH